jgi:predicted SnoaL-like aldol condensation-catalyzing enzyme
VKDIFALRLYTRVARLGSFSAAARECGGSANARPGRAAIPTTRHFSPSRAEPPILNGDSNAENHSRAEQSDCAGGVDTLFNKRDYAAAKRFWSDRYIQHSAHIAPGREGLFDLIRSAPETLRYENQLIVAEGDYVIAHGRFSGNGRPAAWIAADVVRFEDGKLAEHWDVLQDEATRAQSVGPEEHDFVDAFNTHMLSLFNERQAVAGQ